MGPPGAAPVVLGVTAVPYRIGGVDESPATVLFTYGYRFKPWRGPSIAVGGEILAYLDEVIDELDLDGVIRYQHPVTAANWSTPDRRWSVEVTRGDTGQRLRFTTGFLWMCQGYYNHAKLYRPE